MHLLKGFAVTFFWEENDKKAAAEMNSFLQKHSCKAKENSAY